MIKEMKEMAESDTMPAPLVDSPKCPRCSLVGICLPDEVNLLSDETHQTNNEQIRRMYPMRGDTIQYTSKNKVHVLQNQVTVFM